MQQHYVTFYSPGTFVAETNAVKVETWDVDEAVKMAAGIMQRYGARPYGFRFSTRSRTEADLDAKETDRSPMYYLGGSIETVEDVRKRADPKESILLGNMERNGYARIVRNANSYTWTQPLMDGDVVLDVVLPPAKKESA